MENKIILVQSKKGGIGKSWSALQLAHGLAKMTGDNVLILTTDKQNDILSFSGYSEPLRRGLEYWIEHLEGDSAKLRENLYYIPLNTAIISDENVLKAKFEMFLEALQEKFKYIVIDGTPVIELNNLISSVATDIVIPTFLDKVTSIGMMEMLKKFELNKIKAVVPNRASTRSKLEREYYKKLKEVLEPTPIILTCPISQSSVISSLIEKGKTIYDSESQKLLTVKEEFRKVIEAVK